MESYVGENYMCVCIDGLRLTFWVQRTQDELSYHRIQDPGKPSNSCYSGMSVLEYY